MRFSEPRTWLNTLVFLIIIALSFSLYYLRKYNLDFHNRDYQYSLNYFRDAINIFSWHFNPMLLAPDGQSALGFSGVDAFPHTGVTTHLRPIFYLLGVVFYFGGEQAILLLYIFVTAYGIYSFISLFPIDNQNRFLVYALCASIVPFYAYFMTYDLRIYVALIGLLLIVISYICRGYSTWKILAITVLILSTREDAYYFTIIAAAHLYYKGRRRLSLFIILLSIIYISIAFFYFFQIAKYDFNISSRTIGFLLVPLLVFLICIFVSSDISVAHRSHFRAILETALRRRLEERDFGILENFFWFNIYLAPIWARASTKVRISSLFDRYFVLVLAIVVALMVALHFYPRLRSLKITIVGVAISFFIIGASRIGIKVAQFDWQRSDLLWQVAEETSRDSLIVTDLAFHQALWDSKAVVWERLPAESIDDRERYWPTNRRRLVEFVVKADLFVLGPRGLEVIEGLGVRKLTCRQSEGFYVCE